VCAGRGACLLQVAVHLELIKSVRELSVTQPLEVVAAMPRESWRRWLQVRTLRSYAYTYTYTRVHTHTYITMTCPRAHRRSQGVCVCLCLCVLVPVPTGGWLAVLTREGLAVPECLVPLRARLQHQL
jgi:hypothetical protein